MRKTTVLCLLPMPAMLLFVLIPALIQAEPSVYPVGTTIYKPDKCCNGFTILSGGDGRLIDMNGNLAHLWKGLIGIPNKVLPGGHLLVSTGSWRLGYLEAIEIQIRNFNDETLWKFSRWDEIKANEGEGKIWSARQHHDMQIKGNNDYYSANCRALDFAKDTLLVLGHYNVKNSRINRNVQLLDDVVYEVDMASGNVIWTWKAAEHVDEMGFDKAAFKAMQNYAAGYTGEGQVDWFHQNCVSYIGPNKWYDQGDKRFHPDNIILASRHASILAIVDHGIGRIVWKAGPYYREGEDKKLGWIIGPHHTHIIPKGLPGEGNIMVYDNGGFSGYGPPNDMAPDGIWYMRRCYSRVIEFNPVTKDIVWEYSPETLKMNKYQSGHKVFSPSYSSAQRLPNGNTLITEGANGRIIEVTRNLEIVWEYISPYLFYGDEPNYGKILYRAYRIPYDWVPKLPKPKEVAVDPGHIHMFMIPAENGSRPDPSLDITSPRNPRDDE
jgi:hypothetical protein